MDALKQYIKIFLPKTFSQNDPAWKNATLGFIGTIGAYGCLETDATMVANYYEANETPLTLNDKLKANGGFSDSAGKIGKGNLFVWGAFAKLFGLKYSGQFSNSANLTKAQMDQIKGAIDKGFPVFLQIDTIPATSGLDEHWILAIGYNGDDFIVQDPWDGGTKRITSWGVTPQKLIYAWCWFEGKVPAQVSDPTITIPVKERDFLVGRATTAKDVASYLAIDDPDHAPIEAYTKVIAGIKGSVTAIQTTLTEAQKKLAETEQEVENRQEQVSSLKGQVADARIREKSLSDQLNLASANTAKAVGVVSDQLTAMTTAKNIEAAAKGTALKENAVLKSQLEACQKGQPTTNLIQSILDFLRGLGGK